MLSKAFKEVFYPAPENANRSLYLIILFWGLPSLAMLLIPALKWSADHQMSVAGFASMVLGLGGLCAYCRFVGAFIERYNGKGWLREQIFGKNSD